MTNDKKFIYILLVVIILLLIFIFFPTKVQEFPAKYTIPSQIEVIEDNFEIDEEPVRQEKIQKIPKIVTQEKEDEIYEEENITEEFEDNGTEYTFYKTFDSIGKFTISFVSNKNLPLSKHRLNGVTRFISLDGKIRDIDYHGNFGFSLRDDFAKYIDDIQIKVENTVTEKISKCDVFFLNNINKDFSYQIGIDYNDGAISCYMESEEELPEFIKNLDMPKFDEAQMKKMFENSDINFSK